MRQNICSIVMSRLDVREKLQCVLPSLCGGRRPLLISVMYTSDAGICMSQGWRVAIAARRCGSQRRRISCVLLPASPSAPIPHRGRRVSLPKKRGALLGSQPTASSGLLLAMVELVEPQCPCSRAERTFLMALGCSTGSFT